jgi:glycosyltransferase involved in cell wall biosynthesis
LVAAVAMKALFCHDHVFALDGTGKVYSSGQFSASIWDRYLEVFDALIVAGRCRRLSEPEATAGLNLASRPGVSFVFLPNLASFAGLMWRRIEAKRILAEAMKGADAVIVRLPSEIGVLGARLARTLAKPVAVEAAGCAWDGLWHYGTWRAKAYAPLRTWQMRREVGKADFALYVTRQFLQRRYPTRGHAVAVSDVEIGAVDPAVLERRLARIEQRSSPLVLGLIGAIGNEIKGVRTVLEALARTRDALPPFEFRVLGPGDARPWHELATRHGLADAVRFCGVLPSGAAVFDWLDEVDIYLQPSFKEGLPRAMVEAMSRACPALGSTAGGIPELISADCLHRPGGVPQLGRLLVRAATDPDWQRAQAKRNFQQACAYAAEVLDARRRAFWRDFRASVAHGRDGDRRT